MARSRKRLVEVIERELKARGFEKVMPAVWELPDGEKGSILRAIVECMKLEDAAHAERPLADVGEQQLGPFVRDSETSRQAALDNYPRQGSQRQRIIVLLCECPSGLTREEIGKALGIPDKSVGPRVLELIDGGWVEESTETRLTSTGSKATVVQLTEAARAELIALPAAVS